MPLAYALKPDSKLRHNSDVQEAALAAVRAAAGASGIVVLPCGTGKTSVFLQLALPHHRVLYFCYEKQGVIQVADTIRKHTTVPEENICVYTAETKKRPNGLFCWCVATYAIVSGAAGHRSKAALAWREFLTKDMHWDVVILDEMHHTAAATYMPLVKQLKANSGQMLGFTGTLVRNDVNPDDGSGTREETMDAYFAFVGPRLYGTTCRAVEADGWIAKVRRVEVQTRMVASFEEAARAIGNASTRKYIESIHPHKMNALHALVQVHAAQGDVGMVFVNHLLHAKLVKTMLGAGWEVLSGSNAHGEDGVHSAGANAAIVARFNAGELKGIISTPVGESALDAVNPDFRYAVVVDAHGGPAAASQKLGRLARTARFPRLGVDESDAAYRARRLAAQKCASYYEIVTLGTEEVTAAAHRDAQFQHEGYARRTQSYEDLLHTYDAAGLRTGAGELPFDSELAQARLLVEALTYADLGAAAKVGAGQARAHKEQHQKAVRAADKKGKESKHALFRDKHAKRTEKLRKQSGAVNATAKAICKEAVKSAPLSAAVVAVLRQIAIAPAVLKELGVATADAPERAGRLSAAQLAPSDDDDDDEGPLLWSNVCEG